MLLGALYCARWHWLADGGTVFLGNAVAHYWWVPSGIGLGRVAPC